MDFKEFEDVVKKLDKNKYHVGRILGFVDGKPKITKWDIFRKDMSEEEFYDPRNLAILSSDKGNTLEDIKKLVEESE